MPSGIVHRDIKPQNLLIDGDGQVKLCDFGIATLTADDRYRTCTNAVSMRYSSPEDLEHDDPVGPAADIYSLGATLLHLVHGAPPTLRDRLTPWEPPATGDPDLAALDAVIAACLDPDPARRPTAEQLLQSLDDCVLDSGRTGVCELPVVDRVLPLIRFDDVPIDLHEALTLQPPERPGEAIELERPLMIARPKVDGSPRAAFVAAAAAAAVVLLIVGTFVALRAITTSHAAQSHSPDHHPPPTRLRPARGSRLVARWSWATASPNPPTRTNSPSPAATTPTTSSATTKARVHPDVRAAEAAASRRHRLRMSVRSLRRHTSQPKATSTSPKRAPPSRAGKPATAASPATSAPKADASRETPATANGDPQASGRPPP